MERIKSCFGLCFILWLQVCQSGAARVDFEALQAKLEFMDQKISELEQKDLQQQAINKKQTDINQQLQTTIDDLQDVITGLREDSRDYGNTISQLTESLSQQQTTISRLTESLSNQQTTISQLRKNGHNQHICIKRQTSRITTLERHQSKCQSSHRNRQATILPLRKSEDNSSDPTTHTTAPKQTNVKEQTQIQDESNRARDVSDGQHKRLVLASESPVAFMASVSNHIYHLGLGHNIHFDAVQLNLGNGYHNLHGVFIVPKSGIYVFSANVVFYDVTGPDAFATIVKNGNEIATLYSSYDHSWDQGSQTVIVQANQGDEIWVHNKYKKRHKCFS